MDTATLVTLVALVIVSASAAIASAWLTWKYHKRLRASAETLDGFMVKANNVVEQLHTTKSSGGLDKAVADLNELTKDRFLRLERMIVSTEERLYRSEPSPGIAGDVSKLEVLAGDGPDVPHHVRHGGRFMRSVVRDRLGEMCKKLVKYADEPESRRRFVIDSVDTTHEFMGDLATTLLGSGYAYVATSVLKSYARFPNPQFQKFAAALNNSVKEGHVCALRLYYCDSMPSEKAIVEMRSAVSNGFVVRYLITQRVKEIQVEDFSLVFFGKDSTCADGAVSLHSNPDRALDIIAERRTLECALDFDVRDSSELQFVKTITANNMNSDRALELKSRFKDHWRKATAVKGLEGSYFLSYPSSEIDAARRLAAQIHETYGVSAVCDFEDRTGKGFDQLIDAAIEHVGAIVVFVCPTGLSEGQVQECKRFMSAQRTRHVVFPVMTDSSHLTSEHWEMLKRPNKIVVPERDEIVNELRGLKRFVEGSENP